MLHSSIECITHNASSRIHIDCKHRRQSTWYLHMHKPRTYFVANPSTPDQTSGICGIGCPTLAQLHASTSSEKEENNGGKARSIPRLA
ncbi:hypothetical protein BJX63DRAFT_109986 [Aspergillus granulosus]|uniref:Uncharacterized protein n=1 Tax=Aspergillus granulosus TaxID=176169 RepID=A0ABR4HPD4_9EURO